MHRGGDAHAFKVCGHAPTDTPHFRHSRVAQHPVPFEITAQVDHATGVGLEPFGSMVGQLGQGFGVRDAHADRNAGALQDPAAQLTPHCRGVSDPGQFSKRFVNAVHLHTRNHGLDEGHHPFAHVAIQGVV